MRTPRAPVPVLPLGPVAAATIGLQIGESAHLVAIVKVTLALAHGEEAKVLSPLEIVRSEVHVARNPMRHVRYASEVSPYLGRVDVLFWGQAHAPAGKPTSRMSVRLALADDWGVFFEKELDVVGDRSPKASDSPRPFQKMPIVYEKALGGLRFHANPIGTGLEGATRVLPNILHHDPARAGEPAGFGAIPPWWRARKDLLHGHEKPDMEQPAIQLEDGVDWSYFQAAPADQQLPELAERPWIILEGLHPTHERLITRLPPMRAAARFYDEYGNEETVSLCADTLFIDGEAEQCCVCFRGRVPLVSLDALDSMVVAAGVEMPDYPIDWPATPPDRRAIVATPVVPLPRAPLNTVQDVTAADDFASMPVAKALPFAAAGSSGGRPRPLAAVPIPGAPWSPTPAATPALPRSLFDATIADPSTVDDIVIRRPPVEPAAPAVAAAPAPVVAKVEPPLPRAAAVTDDGAIAAKNNPSPAKASVWAPAPEGGTSTPAARAPRIAARAPRVNVHKLVYGVEKKRG